MIRLLLTLVAVLTCQKDGEGPKARGKPLKIPLPFEEAMRAALEVKPKTRKSRKPKSTRG